MQVNTWLGALLQLRGEDLYRMKGILSIDGYDRRFVFQVRYLWCVVWVWDVVLECTGVTAGMQGINIGGLESTPANMLSS
jgi:hypothetical protein